MELLRESIEVVQMLVSLGAQVWPEAVRRSRSGGRYATAGDMVDNWCKSEELAASQLVPASLPPSAVSWSLGDFARWRSTG